MVACRRQHGFLLPLVTALLAMFGGIWLLHQQPPTATERNYLSAVEVQQQLLFWHRGVLHYQRATGYWPPNLTAVAQHFELSPAPAILAGWATVDGFNMAVSGVEKNVLNRVLLPLKDYFTSVGDGSFNLFITTAAASAGAADPRYIERAADDPVLVSSDIDFANHGLHMAEVDATKAHFQTMRSRQVGGDMLKSVSLKSTAISANDVLLGSYSLAQQQQRMEYLYQALWYCVRVSKDCLRVTEVM